MTVNDRPFSVTNSGGTVAASGGAFCGASRGICNAYYNASQFEYCRTPANACASDDNACASFCNLQLSSTVVGGNSLELSIFRNPARCTQPACSATATVFLERWPATARQWTATRRVKNHTNMWAAEERLGPRRICSRRPPAIRFSCFGTSNGSTR